MPPSLRLALATRADPPLPLGRFRARDEVTELRIGDLRFDDDQAAALLNGTLGLDLDRAAVERLRRRTEGWAAGLQLAGLSLRGHADRDAFIASFAGDDRHVVDFLGAEVLDALEPELRDFAVRTSVLERLAAPLCAAVADTPDAAELLETLERRNLFVVPLDESRRWFRWHHLFGDLLRYRLEREQPGLAPELHARAAGWYAREGLVEDAVRHALASGDRDLAGELVAAHWSSVFNRGHVETVSRWLEALPRERVLADERLWLARVWTLLDSGRLDEAEPWLDAGRDEDPWTELLRALHAFKRGRIPAAADGARWGREAAGPASAFWRTVASCLGGLTLFWRGELEAAAPILARGVEIARADANTVAAAYQLAYLALVELGLGRSERAQALVEQADALVRGEPQAGEHFTAAMLHLARARLLAAGEARERELARALELARRGAGAVEVSAAEEALARRAPRAAASGDELSERELEVLRLLSTRLSQREIGSTLYVSLNTVKSHTKSIFRKLGASTRSEAVARARELGLI
jgi:LuxR family maltose regulon positive regulatory protein